MSGFLLWLILKNGWKWRRLPTQNHTNWYIHPYQQLNSHARYDVTGYFRLAVIEVEKRLCGRKSWEPFELELPHFTGISTPTCPTFPLDTKSLTSSGQKLQRKTFENAASDGLGGISRERFKWGSLNFTQLSGITAPTNLPDMTSLVASGRRKLQMNTACKCIKRDQPATSRIIWPLFNVDTPDFSYFRLAFIEVKKKQPKMPPPMALGRILVVLRFAYPTNCWASCFYLIKSFWLILRSVQFTTTMLWNYVKFCCQLTFN